MSNPADPTENCPPIPSQVAPGSVRLPRLELDPAKLNTTQMYKLLIGGVVPRPIAFISTMSPEGVGNLAPFSFFNAVSSDPPCLMISIACKGNGEKKDSLRNIEATGQFVVNTVGSWMADAVNQASAEYPYGVDEIEKIGLTSLPASVVKPYLVQESPLNFECEFYRSIEVGEPKAGASTVVIGRIVRVHLMSGAYDEHGRVNLEVLHPLSRLAGFSYGLTSEVFDLPRPKL